MSTEWEYVVQLPWKPIRQLPEETWECFYAGEPSAAKRSGAANAQNGRLEESWNGSGVSVYTVLPKKNEMMKTGILRMQTQDSCVRLVFQLGRSVEDKHMMRFDEDEWERLRGLRVESELVVQGTQFKRRGNFKRG